MDLLGPRIDFLAGLDIVGKLVFPESNKQLVVYSTMIVIQGELDVKSTGEVGAEPKVNFIMTGDQDQTFVPVGNNAGKCNGAPTIMGFLEDSLDA